MEHDSDFQKNFDSIVNDHSVPEAENDFSPDVYDSIYLNMEVVIPRDRNGPGFYQVTRSFLDKGRLPVVKAGDNPVLDTRMYDIKYPYGHKSSHDKNYIA